MGGRVATVGRCWGGAEKGLPVPAFASLVIKIFHSGRWKAPTAESEGRFEVLVEEALSEHRLRGSEEL